MKKLFFVFILCLNFLIGCNSLPTHPYEHDADAIKPEDRIFEATPEKTWKAVQLAFSEYPIRVNNQEAGVLETDLIRSDQGFLVPGKEKKPAPTGRRYRLLVRVLKHNEMAGLTRVIIRKVIEKQKDFFTSPEQVASDRLEELSLMYRVERELAIDLAADNKDLDLE